MLVYLSSSLWINREFSSSSFLLEDSFLSLRNLLLYRICLHSILFIQMLHLPFIYSFQPINRKRMNPLCIGINSVIFNMVHQPCFLLMSNNNKTPYKLYYSLLYAAILSRWISRAYKLLCLLHQPTPFMEPSPKSYALLISISFSLALLG